MESQGPVKPDLSPSCVERRLEADRQDLLDLSTRTRLPNTPQGTRVKTVEVVDEIAEEVFRILVINKKSMSFLLGPDDPAIAEGEQDDPLSKMLAQPEEELNERGVATRHADTRLQTKMPSVRLQRRLLQIYRDRISFEQEQGVNILYLALGFLQSYEAPTSERLRRAPLILVPAIVHRASANQRFRVEYTGEDLITNLSLQARTRGDFGIELPELDALNDATAEGAPVAEYLDAVRGAVRGQERWEVVADDIVLGFFSFAKFLMYRDLDPSAWPAHAQIADHPILNGLLCDGFGDSDDPFAELGEREPVLDEANALHVMDADSSQGLAIEAAKQARSLVIQGPPGTGKSQTITNLIASAVRDGKKVLFVAEKMAALDVVKRRMDSLGLGPLCLELHSHKARKKDVLEDLKATLALGRPTTGQGRRGLEQLERRREELNGHAARMHAPLDASRYTPYQILGRLVSLGNRGIASQNFRVEGARTWSREQLAAAEGQVERLSRQLERMGKPADHAWRGVGLKVALPQDMQRLVPKIASIHEGLSMWRSRIRRLSSQFGVPCDTTRQVPQLVQLVWSLLEAPPMDPSAASSRVWKDREREIDQLVQAGQTLAESRARVDPIFVADAWKHDLLEVRRNLKAYGGSIFRLLNGAYRRSLAKLRSFAKDELPKKLNDRVRLLDALAEGRAAKELLEEREALGREAFGQDWNGSESDWNQLANAAKWVSTAESLLVDSVPGLLARLGDRSGTESLVRDVEGGLVPITEGMRSIVRQLELDQVTAWGAADMEDVPLSTLATALASWVDDPESIHSWIAYRLYDQEARALGLGEICDRLSDGRIEPTKAVLALRAAYFEELIRQVYEEVPELGVFRGHTHAEAVAEFKQLDLMRIELARSEVAAAHYLGLPRTGGAGEIGIVRREMEKKSRHLPLRVLLGKAGHAVQSIKPVFMMSPMSIAQYLDPGILQFDIVVMDEASQIRPIEALGAIARGKQVVVVGDEKQLPPTRFFDRVSDGVRAEDDEDFAVGDLESILGLCRAQGVPSRMLRWHYRSRHESLIAVSNREFYDSRLFIIPSPEAGQDLGIRFHKVDGVFDRGGSATNRIEAGTVARAVMQHAVQRPDLTLGVGCFSVAQRDAIEDELELLRREHPETEHFFTTSGPEPFFVKNLESVQGDERDVIFISVGYGPDVNGRFYMSFGPLSADGGERRMNVLISRAKQRCEVFSSITAGDIDLSRARGRGPAVLKTFLHYAESGFLEVPKVSGREADSVFEEEVAKALRGYGYDVHNQVGISGFFVDLAVRDPDQSGRYVIGIECDGASYHSSKSARDRDRLRQQILEDRGWVIHRIWSTDWFQQPEATLKRTIEAIERARHPTPVEAVGGVQVPSQPRMINAGMTASTTGSDIERIAEEELDSGDSVEADAYQEAEFRVSATCEPHEAKAEQLLEAVVRIVETEGPIHVQEVGRRLATVWGLGRAGSRIQDAARRAVERAQSLGSLKLDGEFARSTNGVHARPRSRRNVFSTTLRKAEMIPPVEMRMGLRRIVETYVGIEPGEAAPLLARMLGFDRLGGDLRQAFEKEIRGMLADEQLRFKDGKLYVA